jgi:hypothetical protein
LGECCDGAEKKKGVAELDSGPLVAHGR